MAGVDVADTLSAIKNKDKEIVKVLNVVIIDLINFKKD